RVAAGLENDRYRGGCRLCCEPGCGRSASRNDTDLIANELSSHRRQPVILTIRPPIFDQHVAALYVANFTQTPSQRNNPFDSRTSVEIPNHRRRRLLRARRQRPRSHRAAEQRYERAALHSITLSARSRKLSGIVSPISFAVLRLIASVNLVGCSTGKSAGLAPLRMRSI